MKRKFAYRILFGLVIFVIAVFCYNWSRPESQLIRAVSCNDLLKTRILLETHPHLKEFHFIGLSPLHIAADRGSIAIVRLLLDNSFPLDSQDTKGATPLDKAVWSRELAVVQVLLDSGANANIADNNGGSSMHYLAAASPSDLSLALEGALSDSDRTNQVHRRQEQIASALIDAGAKVDVASDDGTTPLHLAARAGNAQLIRLLIAFHADVLQKDDKGNTALHYAALNGSSETVKLLLREGADVRARNKSGQLPVDLAVQNKRAVVIPLLR